MQDDNEMKIKVEVELALALALALELREAPAAILLLFGRSFACLSLNCNRVGQGQVRLS